MLRFFRLLLRPLEFGGRGGYFEISRLAWPLIIMGASNTIMQFVDRKFLSSLSTTAVAAALPAGILYFTLFFHSFPLVLLIKKAANHSDCRTKIRCCFAGDKTDFI